MKLLVPLILFFFVLTSVKAQTTQYPWMSRVGGPCASVVDGTDHAACLDSSSLWLYKCQSSDGTCGTPINGYQWTGSSTGVSTAVNVGIGTTFTTTSALTVMNGNVGIGTWKPTSLLAVGSTAPVFIGNNAITMSTGTITINSAVTMGQNGFSAATGATSGNFYSASGSSLTSGTDYNATTSSNNFTGDLFRGQYSGTNTGSIGNFGISNASASGTVLKLTNSGTGPALTITGSGSYNVGIGTTTPMGGFIVTNGNVGIGTWVPGNLLQIGDGANSHGFQVNGNGNIVAIGDTTGASLSNTTLNLSNAGGNAIVEHNSSSSGSNLTIVASTGNVNGQLILKTTTGVGTSDLIAFSGGNNGGTRIATMLGTGNVGIGSATPNAILDVEGTVNPAVFFATIPATGTEQNVGIGSFHPGQALDVVGTVRATNLVMLGGTSSQFLKANGSTDSSSYITGNQTITLSSDVTGSGTTAITATLKNTGTSGTYRSTTFDAQGRETSGTNPTTFSGYAISDTSANLASALTDEVGTGSAVFNGSPNFTGNVGIGSTNPGSQLEVQGTIRILGSGNGNIGIGSLNPQASLDLGTTGTMVSHRTTGLGWSEHNATNQACNTTCGSSACVVGLDIGTVGVTNSGFVACTDTTADDCLCAGA